MLLVVSSFVSASVLNVTRTGSVLSHVNMIAVTVARIIALEKRACSGQSTFHGDGTARYDVAEDNVAASDDACVQFCPN